MTILFENLLFNLGLLMLGMLLLWSVAVKIHDVSFIDAVWVYGMGALAVISLIVATDYLAELSQPASEISVHAIALTVLTTLWAVRLGTHLLLRWRPGVGAMPRHP